jgi:type IV pilus assembly protein PilA
VIERQRGFSLIELVIVLSIVLVLLGLAIPNLLRAKDSARDAAAVAAMRAIHQGESIYLIQYGSYAPSLANLGPPKPGTRPSAEAADLIDANLAAGFLRGYLLSYQVVDLDGDGLPDGYLVKASPESGPTQRRSYEMDHKGTLAERLSQPPKEGPSGGIGK